MAAYPQMSAEILRRRLDEAGYDTTQLDDLSLALRVDLMPILAGWAPVLASLYSPVPVIRLAAPKQRRPWWKRLFRLFIGLTEENNYGLPSR